MSEIIDPGGAAAAAGAGMTAWAGRKLLGPLLDDIAEGWRERGLLAALCNWYSRRTQRRSSFRD